MSVETIAPAAVFEPGQWLARFADAGGWWAVADGRLWLGWRYDTNDQVSAARAVFRDVEKQPDRLAMVRAEVRAASGTGREQIFVRYDVSLPPLHLKRSPARNGPTRIQRGGSASAIMPT